VPWEAGQVSVLPGKAALDVPDVEEEVVDAVVV